MNLQNLVIGALAGAGVTVAIYEVRDPGEQGGAKAPSEHGLQATVRQSAPVLARKVREDSIRNDLNSLRGENAGLKAHNNLLKAAARRNDIAATDGDQRWVNKGQSAITIEMPVDQWRSKYPQSAVDRRIESTIRDRIESHLDAVASDATVECRDGCCRMSMTTDDPDKLGEILGTSVGVGWFPAETTTIAVKDNHLAGGLCLGGNQAPDLDAMPDRGIERDALAENVLPVLSICAKEAEAGFDLKMTLTIDLEGQISDIDSSEKYAGHAAAECAGSALLTHSAFAPWTRVTTMILEFRLDPERGASLL